MSLYAVAVAAQHMLLAADENNVASAVLHTFVVHLLVDFAET